MCTRPNIGYPCCYTEKGKLKYQIISYKEATKLNLCSPFKNNENNLYGNAIFIPCGKCQECKLNYAKKWSDRCMLELQDHKSSYFITLTYNDRYLPISFNEEGFEELTLGLLSTGAKYTPTLRLKDFQKFMKRLREKFEDQKLRFYMCGEYGSQTKRPHYHAIIFGLELSDLKIYKVTPLHDILYTSETLSKLWPFGFVIIGQVTPQSVAYVARYVMKKQGYDKEFYKKLNISPEFTRMSLKPGIGYNAYSPEIFRKGYASISTERGGIKVFPPKYFEKFFELDYPEELNELKEKRIEAMRCTNYGTSLHTSKRYCDTFDDKEICNENKINYFRKEI